MSRGIALLAALLVAGCAHKSAVAPGEAGAAAPAPDAARLADLEAALASEEDRLRSAGVPMPSMESKDMSLEAVPQADESTPAPVATQAAEEQRPRRDLGGRRCRNVCDLKAAICDLQTQICGLRERHADEPRYRDVCGRAIDDCRIATEACDACA